MIAHLAGAGHRHVLRVACRTERGARPANEDFMGLADLGPRGLCCVLSDGAGGHGNGALAARITVDAVLEAWRQHPLFSPAGLASLISMAEQAVASEQPTSVSRREMTATVVMLCIDPRAERALWAHWGDSRLYWFRGGVVCSITQDHSVVQQLRKAGLYQDEDLRRLPHRNMLVGAVGADSQVPPSVLQQAVDLHAGDAFLLCSDGLWDRLDEPAMEAALKRCPSPAVWLERMAQSVLAADKPDQDNLSALAVWIAPGDDEADAAAPAPPSAAVATPEPDPS